MSTRWRRKSVSLSPHWHPERDPRPRPVGVLHDGACERGIGFRHCDCVERSGVAANENAARDTRHLRIVK